MLMNQSQVHMALKVSQPWDFSGGPAVKTLYFHCRNEVPSVVRETKIP